MKKKIIALLITGTMLLSPLTVMADEKDDRIAELEAQVAEMQLTIDDLQKQLEEALTKLSSGNTDEKFIEDVKVAITGTVGDGEFITDVTFTDGDLCVYVDLMQSDPAPFTYEDLALTRTSSITDAILDLSEYYNSWNTVTVDFGTLGHIRNDKTNVADNGYGLYFESINFVLE